jgi:hypothetical protein
LSLIKEVILTKNKDPEADITSLDDEIDEIVYELYNLEKEEIEIVRNS